MPRGRLLSKEEKIKFETCKNAGLSNREIVKKINRFHHLIDNFIDLGDLDGKNHHCREGRNLLLFI